LLEKVWNGDRPATKNEDFEDIFTCQQDYADLSKPVQTFEKCVGSITLYFFRTLDKDIHEYVYDNPNEKST